MSEPANSKQGRLQRRKELQEERMDCLEDDTTFCRTVTRATVNDAVMRDLINRVGIPNLSGRSRVEIAAASYALAHRVLTTMNDVSEIRRFGKPKPAGEGISITGDDALKALVLMKVPPPVNLLGGVGIRGERAEAVASAAEAVAPV